MAASTPVGQEVPANTENRLLLAVRHKTRLHQRQHNFEDTVLTLKLDLIHHS